MTHVDPDVLALVALGEPVDDDVRAHLATCAQCRTEVDELARVVGAARAVTSADTLVAPPPTVWDGVSAELGLGTDAGGRPAGAASPHQGEGPAATRARRGRTTPWALAAAVAGIAVGAAGATWYAGRDTGPMPEVVAEAQLDPLPGWAARGRAVVEVAADGTRELVVTLSDADGVGGFQEVWLIDRDVTRLVSLGLLVGDEGRFTLPDDLDLGEFPVVDVSDEPYDGDPSHSGDSIIRGVLDA